MIEWSGRISPGFGPDWLLRARTSEKGEVVTFYSYKGGTGRSLALVNCAGLIAQHLPSDARPMLLIDFDLEAPGLHRYLASYLPEPRRTEQEGVLELFAALLDAVDRELAARAAEGKEPAARLDDEAAAGVVEAIDLLPYVIETGLRPVRLLQAGRFDDSYDQRLMDFPWKALFDKAPALFRCLAERLARDYSFVFIDSRTGLSDTTGVSTMLLPDALVIVFTPNTQSLTGVDHLVRKAVEYRASSADLRRLRVYPLPSRVDTQVEHFRRVWRMGESSHPLFGNVLGYQPMFVQSFKDIFHVNEGMEARVGEYFDVVQIPHSSDYAYGERLCFTSAASNDSLSLRGAYEQFLPWLVTGALPWQRPAEVLSEQQVEWFLFELGAQVIPAEDAWLAWFERLSGVVGDRITLYGSLAERLNDEQRANIDLALALALAHRGDLKASAELLERESESRGIEECYSTLALAIVKLVEIWKQNLTPLAAATEERRAWLAAADRLFDAMKPGRLLTARWSVERKALLDHAPWLILSVDVLKQLRASDGRKLGKDQRVGMLRAIRKVAVSRKVGGDLGAARVLGKQVLEICRRVFGSENAETLAAQDDLASTLRAQGDVAGAQQLEEQARESRREVVDKVRERRQSARPFRIFVSSPGDVAEERQLVRKVIDQLSTRPELRERLRLEVVAWEDALSAVPSTSGDSPQALINRRGNAPHDCDLTIVILWSRIGVQLPTDQGRSDAAAETSGTLWVLQDAMAAGKPVMVYRRTSKPQLDIDDRDFEFKRAQYLAVGRFFAEFTGVFRPYRTPAEFEQVLTRDLELTLSKVDAAAEVSPETASPGRGAAELSERAVDLEGRLVASSSLASGAESLPYEIRQWRVDAIHFVLWVQQESIARSEGAEAISALEAGNPLPAVQLLGMIVDATDNVEQRPLLARLARGQAALAYGVDPEAALAASERAAAYDPDDRAARFLMGYVLYRLGRADDALRSFREAGRLAEMRVRADQNDLVAQRDLSNSHVLVGDVLSARGEVTEALQEYRTGLAMIEALTAIQPENAEWQRELAAWRLKIGDLLGTRGDVAGSLAAYRAVLPTVEALAAQDPSNAVWQRHLAVCQTRVGYVLSLQEDLSGALAAYRSALAIFEAVAARDPANPESQHDLMQSRSSVGDVLASQGDLEGALSAYRGSLLIAQALSDAAPADVARRGDLASSHLRAGDVLRAMRDLDGALTAYGAGLSIAMTLAHDDPASSVWQREVSVGANRVGDVLAMKGENADALTAYQNGLTMFQTLTARDPDNAQWQRDLSMTYDRIGDVLAANGDEAAALEAYQKGFGIHEALAKRDPSSTTWLTDVAQSCARLGQLAFGQTTRERRKYLTRGREILVALESEQRLRPGTNLIAWFDEKLAELESVK